MQRESPFIKKFRTRKNSYIYDVNTNRLLLVNPIIFKIIPFLGSFSKEEIFSRLENKIKKTEFAENYEIIQQLQKKYFVFSTSRPERRGSQEAMDEKSLLDTYNKENIGQMCLELTQQCNLRCKYCVYSGKYKYQRIHNNRVMSYATARKAIEFYIERAESDRGSISFFGGEPLLRFDILKKCANHIKYKLGKKKLGIRICTNGILLNDMSIEFIIKNKIDLQISVDGPKSHHDKYRTFKNGKGSFNQVKTILEKIKKIDSNYYRKHIILICVITPSTNLIELNNFFLTNHLTKDVSLRIGYIDSKDTVFFNSCRFNKNQKNEEKKLWQLYSSGLIKNKEEYSTILDPSFRQILENLYNRNIYNKPKSVAVLNGPCMPGLRKLFVSCDGNFHICEKMNPFFPIGNIDSGFDYKKVKSLWEKFLVNDSNCLNCWALNFCDICFATVAKDGYLELSNRELVCKKTKAYYLAYLKQLANILERNPDISKTLSNKHNSYVS